MGLEAVTHISDLVATNPALGDPKSEGDDHIRNIKSALKTDFPNVNNVVSASDEELSGLAAAGLASVHGSMVMSANWAVGAISLRKMTKDFACLSGYFQASGSGSTASITTIQAGYRPAVNVYFPATFIDFTASTGTAGYITINASGVVAFFGPSGLAIAMDAPDLVIVNATYKLA